jgi:hypothetical protein
MQSLIRPKKVHQPTECDFQETGSVRIWLLLSRLKEQIDISPPSLNEYGSRSIFVRCVRLQLITVVVPIVRARRRPLLACLPACLAGGGGGGGGGCVPRTTISKGKIKGCKRGVKEIKIVVINYNSRLSKCMRK